MKTKEDKLKALERLKQLDLPAGSPEEMEKMIIEGALDDRRYFQP